MNDSANPLPLTAAEIKKAGYRIRRLFDGHKTIWFWISLKSKEEGKFNHDSYREAVNAVSAEIRRRRKP